MYGNYTLTFDLFGTPKMRLFLGILDKVISESTVDKTNISVKKTIKKLCIRLRDVQKFHQTIVILQEVEPDAYFFCA